MAAESGGERREKMLWCVSTVRSALFYLERRGAIRLSRGVSATAFMCQRRRWPSISELRLHVLCIIIIERKRGFRMKSPSRKEGIDGLLYTLLTSPYAEWNEIDGGFEKCVMIRSLSFSLESRGSRRRHGFYTTKKRASKRTIIEKGKRRSCFPLQ